MVKQVTIIESHVVEGYVGNRAASPVLQLLGYDVLEIPTVVYTCRVGWPGFAGSETEPSLLATLLDYAVKRQSPVTVTGYLGSMAGVQVVIAALANAGGRLIVDPVMGDYPGGLYVPTEVAATLTEDLVPLANVVTPNRFEAEYISGLDIVDINSALKAAAKISSLGPEAVVITSCQQEGDLRAKNLVFADGQAVLLSVPFIDTKRPIYGAGDMFTALTAGLFSSGVGIFTAAAVATGIVGRTIYHAWSNNRDTVDPITVMSEYLGELADANFEKILTLTECNQEEL